MKCGTKLSFYNVRTGEKEIQHVQKFIHRNTSKGRIITLAVALSKSGDKLYRIVANKRDPKY